ncbi:ABC transporter substrate-binding protein [Evansella cellulosilytica]|uniref:Extracellular solute-binding protein family 1 n=1 Tax=Evansella cellulosilytica (strain ATCC 21833 / DSM 2522 / FERM P-1141 / JCM 9156 / N-4) TaxID=649639 RepID=E6TQD3_EVAC2|nr:extracellular solute-binding protein [Evansella cellulosilytica]ADU29311.1 extracellular solute-binding protein family 1 [Evansella cellulosilytica DSM 2522]
MKKFKKLFAATVISLAMLVAAGCGDQPTNEDQGDADNGGGDEVVTETPGDVGDAEITLEFWNGFTGPDGEDIAKIIAEFNNLHEGEIAIRTQTMPWDNFYDQYRTVVTAGEAPDIAIMHLDSIAGYARYDLLTPLDDLAADIGLEDDDFIPEVWDAGVYEGHRYGIPLDVHPLTLFYNVDLLEAAGYSEPPTTYDELVEMSLAVQEATDGDAWGIAMPVFWPSNMIFYSSLMSHGGDSVSEDGLTPLYNTEIGYEALQKMVDLVYEHEVSPSDVQADGEVTLFRQGNSAFHINGIWMIAGFEQQDGLNFAAAPVPTFGDQEAVWAGSHNFVLPKQNDEDPERLEASMKFIQFVSENSLQWAKAGQVPATYSVLESDEFKALEHQYNASQQNFVFPPSTPFYGDAWGPTGPAVDEAMLGQLTPQEALERAAREGEENARDAAEN